jgi:hypothetical protein
LVLVLSTDLEEVEEVGGRGMDGDEVLCGFRLGRREVEDFEIFRTLMLLVGMHVFERGEELEATLTYSLSCMPFIMA